MFRTGENDVTLVLISRARVLVKGTGTGKVVHTQVGRREGCWKKENARRCSGSRLFIDFQVDVQFSAILIKTVKLFAVFFKYEVSRFSGRSRILSPFHHATPLDLPHAFLGRLSPPNTSGRMLTRAKSSPLEALSGKYGSDCLG